jgi:beta-glucosidase
MKGRTYRYFNDALFPFGYGLSYTTFLLDDNVSVVRGAESAYTAEAQPVFEIDAELSNTGNRPGSTIVQVYIRNLQDPDGPLKSLREFRRTDNIKPGQKCHVNFILSHNSFEFWDSETNAMRVKPGKYEILVGTSSADSDLKRIEVTL